MNVCVCEGQVFKIDTLQMNLILKALKTGGMRERGGGSS